MVESAEIEKTLAEFGARGAQALGITADVTDYKQVEALVDQAVKKCGRIDILVNNVGVAWGPYGPIARGWFYEQDPREWAALEST